MEVTVAESLVTGEGSPVMGGENQVTDEGILAMRRIGQVSDVKTHHLHLGLTTTALARHILARNASTQHHNILLESKRSSQVGNWLLLS